MINLPQDAQERKAVPVWTAFVKYFPNAIVAVAKHAAEGSKQHHPDDDPWWDMSKSTDEMDALMRHALEGHHEAVAWRGMANLERKILNGYKPKEKLEYMDEDDLPNEPMSFGEFGRSRGFTQSATGNWHSDTGFIANRSMQDMHLQYLKTQTIPNGFVGELD